MKPEIWITLRALIETELEGIKKTQEKNGMLDAKTQEGLHGLISAMINLAAAERELKDLLEPHKF